MWAKKRFLPWRSGGFVFTHWIFPLSDKIPQSATPNSASSQQDSKTTCLDQTFLTLSINCIHTCTPIMQLLPNLGPCQSDSSSKVPFGHKSGDNNTWNPINLWHFRCQRPIGIYLYIFLAKSLVLTSFFKLTRSFARSNLYYYMYLFCTCHC